MEDQIFNPRFGESKSGTLWCVFQTIDENNVPIVAVYVTGGWRIRASERFLNHTYQTLLDEAYHNEVTRKDHANCERIGICMCGKNKKEQ